MFNFFRTNWKRLGIRSTSSLSVGMFFEFPVENVSDVKSTKSDFVGHYTEKF